MNLKSVNITTKEKNLNYIPNSKDLDCLELNVTIKKQIQSNSKIGREEIKLNANANANANANQNSISKGKNNKETTSKKGKNKFPVLELNCTNNREIAESSHIMSNYERSDKLYHNIAVNNSKFKLFNIIQKPENNYEKKKAQEANSIAFPQYMTNNLKSSISITKLQQKEDTKIELQESKKSSNQNSLTKNIIPTRYIHLNNKSVSSIPDECLNLMTLPKSEYGDDNRVNKEDIGTFRENNTSESEANDQICEKLYKFSSVRFFSNTYNKISSEDNSKSFPCKLLENATIDLNSQHLQFTNASLNGQSKSPLKSQMNVKDNHSLISKFYKEYNQTISSIMKKGNKLNSEMNPNSLIKNYPISAFSSFLNNEYTQKFGKEEFLNILYNFQLIDMDFANKNQNVLINFVWQIVSDNNENENQKFCCSKKLKKFLLYLLRIPKKFDKSLLHNCLSNNNSKERDSKNSKLHDLQSNNKGLKKEFEKNIDHSLIVEYLKKQFRNNQFELNNKEVSMLRKVFDSLYFHRLSYLSKKKKWKNISCFVNHRNLNLQFNPMHSENTIKYSKQFDQKKNFAESLSNSVRKINHNINKGIIKKMRGINPNNTIQIIENYMKSKSLSPSKFKYSDNADEKEDNHLNRILFIPDQKHKKNYKEKNQFFSISNKFSLNNSLNKKKRIYESKSNLKSISPKKDLTSEEIEFRDNKKFCTFKPSINNKINLKRVLSFNLNSNKKCKSSQSLIFNSINTLRKNSRNCNDTQHSQNKFSNETYQSYNMMNMINNNIKFYPTSSNFRLIHQKHNTSSDLQSNLSSKEIISNSYNILKEEKPIIYNKNREAIDFMSNNNGICKYIQDKKIESRSVVEKHLLNEGKITQEKDPSLEIQVIKVNLVMASNLPLNKKPKKITP